MKIEILGSGCKKCTKLYDIVKEVVADKNIEAEICKIEDIMEIMKYNIMTTPALVIDGEIKIKGKLPSKKEVEELF
jgi:small redox-active disulfide protein 2